MRTTDLFEGPREDADALNRASKAAAAFHGFLISQHVPYAEMPGGEDFRLPQQVRAFPAKVLGLPYDDLYIGFGWGHAKASTQATMVRVQRPDPHLGMQTFYVLVQWLAEDPSAEADLSWAVNRSSLIHEFTHYLDYKRGHEAARRKQLGRLYRPKSNADFERQREKEQRRVAISSDPDAYYNSAKEMNAYYQQGAHAIAGSLARMARGNREMGERLLADSGEFFRWAMREFDYGWAEFLTPENRRKVMRRLAKLYIEVKAAWPDVSMLRQALGQDPVPVTEATAARDTDAYAEADRIMGHLIRHLMDGDRMDHYGFKGYRFADGEVMLCLTGEQVGLTGDEAKLMFRFGKMQGYATGGHFAMFKLAGTPVITIHCLDDMGDTEAAAKRIIYTTPVHDVLMHEITHYLDSKRRRRASLKGTSADDGAAYFNDPREFNAYYTNLASPLLNFLRMARSAEESEGLNLGRVAQQLGISRDFNETLKGLLRVRHANSVSLRRFYENLSERNRRALMKRLYNLHHEVLALLGPAPGAAAEAA